MTLLDIIYLFSTTMAFIACCGCCFGCIKPIVGDDCEILINLFLFRADEEQEVLNTQDPNQNVNQPVEDAIVPNLVQIAGADLEN